MAERVNCRSCGASILWCRTGAGKRMPVDPEPVAGGNIILMADGSCVVLTKEQAAGCPDDLHRSHFATCPNAKQHRKGKE